LHEKERNTITANSELRIKMFFINFNRFSFFLSVSGIIIK
jgi:hypothetical protein